MGPKILGDQVNISPIMVISAIIIGGGFFGVIGMFLAVPLFALIKKMMKVYVDGKLNKKNINISL